MGTSGGTSGYDMGEGLALLHQRGRCPGLPRRRGQPFPSSIPRGTGGWGTVTVSYQEMQFISYTLVGSMLPFLSFTIFLLPRVSIPEFTSGDGWARYIRFRWSSIFPVPSMLLPYRAGLGVPYVPYWPRVFISDRCLFITCSKVL